jgi:hypothetical protein
LKIDVGREGAVFGAHVDLHGFASLQVLYDLHGKSVAPDQQKYWFGVLPDSQEAFQRLIRE